MIISHVNAQTFRKPLNKDHYKTYLEEYLESERPFLTSGFSLQVMSLQTSINVPTLSALVNKEYGINFNDLINQDRVAFFKVLVRNPQCHQRTLEAIVNKAGFDFRTTFIRAFTKFAECPPSEYLRFVKMNLVVA